MKTASNKITAPRPQIGFPKGLLEPLSPYNWDFRMITKPFLQTAIRAEYLRSWPEFRTAANAWLAKEIDGKTIRQHMFEFASKGEYAFQGKVGEALPEFGGENQQCGGPFNFLAHDPLYPAPFTWLLEKGIIKEREPRTKPILYKLSGIAYNLDDTTKWFDFKRLVNIEPIVKKGEEYDATFWSLQNSRESFSYLMRITFDGHTNEELVKAFAFWLKAEAKKKRKVLVQGKASTIKWHRLKQLAAKRLSDAGLNYKDALRMIAEREKAAPSPVDYNKVLPKYNSPGAWHDAIKDANLFVELMQKNFRFEGWELL